MKCTLDRITGEHGILLLDNGLAFTLPLAVIQALGAAEGDVLDILIDRTQTADLKQSARTKLNALFARTAEKHSVTDTSETDV